jgi:hypothetical protein
VRNNFVTRGPEAGIKAIHTQDCKILNNTVHEPKSRQKRLLWLIFDNDGLVVKNNLLSGPGGVRNTAKGKIILKNNLSLDATEFFVDPKNGNLHLKKPLPAAVDKAEPLPDVTNDVDGKARGKLPDIGADEL